MTPDQVSVIVVSRGRPQALVRCLAGIEQLDGNGFELVVVADGPGLQALGEAGFATRIKAEAFDQPNISVARNLGLGQAAGEVVAFIDDDAVPEPTWLRRLAAPFAQDIAAAGGFVRGRNGISFQNRARRVDWAGRHRRLAISAGTQVFDATPGDAVKTEGTNCAFRRDILCAMGGFDPAFAFYLDETDVNLRLAADCHRTAIVPGAQVHHGFAASDQRAASRMPRTLYDVGASKAAFLRKHGRDNDPQPILTAFRAEQRARLIRHMVAGTCEPRDLARVLATLEQGLADGATRAIGQTPALTGQPPDFLPFTPRKRFTGHTTLAGRIWNRAALRAQASAAVNDGQRVSLYLFSPTPAYHRVAFRQPGYWEQTGGLFGRSDRGDPMLRFWTFTSRHRAEEARVFDERHVDL